MESYLDILLYVGLFYYQSFEIKMELLLTGRNLYHTRNWLLWITESVVFLSDKIAYW
jgi:hypothetical protein